jgi:ATP-dependent Clp protease ATP-binding subunit ClpC
MLLQILEEGKLTDTLGRRIDFRNSIIIMTSNIGAEQVIKGSGLGFGSGNQIKDFDKIRDQLMDMAKKRFKPEFVNRVDDIIVFRQLVREDLLKIIDIEIAKVRERLKYRGLELEADQAVMDFLIERGFQPEYGARPLRRSVERYLEDALAEEILRGNFKKANKVIVRVDNNKLLFFPENDSDTGILRKSVKTKKTSRKKAEKT